MAKTVTISGPFPGGAIAQQAASFVVTVASASSDAAVTLSALTVSAPPGVTVSQPTIFPNNVPANSANPTLSAGGSLSYGFQAVFSSPRDPGISPQNPGGAAPGQRAQEPYSVITLQAQALFSDGVVISSSLSVSVLTAALPFPRPEGGALIFQQGNNANLIAAIL